MSEVIRLHTLFRLRRLRTKVPQTPAVPDACSSSLTAIPSADAHGPPRGRPDRAAAAWPCLASRSDNPGKRTLRDCRRCHTAPMCRSPGQPRCITAARQSATRAPAGQATPRGGPRQRRGIAVSEINKPLAQRRLRKLRTQVPQTQALPEAATETQNESSPFSLRRTGSKMLSDSDFPQFYWVQSNE